MGLRTGGGEIKARQGQLRLTTSDEFSVTAPRRVLPNSVYMVTRRCVQRQFLLRPGRTTADVFGYCLGLAASQFNIGVIAATVMGNHYHALIHDRDGLFPKFLECLHRNVAKCLNAAYGRWENFWSTEETCVTRLPTSAEVLDKLVYVITNPVTADLVDEAASWPGFTTWKLPPQGQRFERPRHYFRSDDRDGAASARRLQPSTVILSLSPPPPSHRIGSVEEWNVLVAKAVRGREGILRAERARRRIRIPNRRRLVDQSWSDQPSSTARHRKLRPVVSGHGKVFLEEIRSLQEFRRNYRKARLLLAGGFRDVPFPFGTWKLRMVGLTCHPPPN